MTSWGGEFHVCHRTMVGNTWPPAPCGSMTWRVTSVGSGGNTYGRQQKACPHQRKPGPRRLGRKRAWHTHREEASEEVFSQRGWNSACVHSTSDHPKEQSRVVSCVLCPVARDLSEAVGRATSSSKRAKGAARALSCGPRTAGTAPSNPRPHKRGVCPLTECPDALCAAGGPMCGSYL